MREMYEQVESVIESIRPALQSDGGDVELMGVVAGIVTVHLTGACIGCPMSTMTLKMGIEREIRKHVPEIVDVVAV
jgi:Fe-S cluster biogenesis protein NfuA